MVNKQKYLTKIKKLLALAKSTNPNEAAIALRQAQKLMQEHQITATDVDLSIINEFSSKGAPTHAEKIPEYMSQLTSLICDTFGCRAYFSWSPDAKRIITFYGSVERPQVAAYSYDVLNRQLVKARKEFLSQQNKRVKRSTKTARADSFCEGWIVGASRSIESLIISTEEHGRLALYKSKLNLVTAKTRESKVLNGCDNAYQDGYLEGKNASIHRGVSGQQQFVGGLLK